MGKIYLNDMNFYAHHGCYEDEMKVGAYFKVDLEISYDSEVAETTDDINNAVSYLDLYQLVRTEVMKPSHLLENIGRRILDAVFERFPEISDCNIRIVKLAPPLGGDIRKVTVEIGRNREDSYSHETPQDIKKF